MHTNQNEQQPFHILSLAIAYLLGGIFIYTADAAGVSSLTAHIFGGIFMAFAFFLVIASCVDRLTGLADRVHAWLFLALFIASMGRLIITAVNTHAPLFMVIAAVFSFFIVGALLFRTYRSVTYSAARLGKKSAAIRLLRVLSLVFSLCAVAMVIMQVSFYGGPILFLALALVCLSISSLL